MREQQAQASARRMEHIEKLKIRKNKKTKSKSPPRTPDADSKLPKEISFDIDAAVAAAEHLHLMSFENELGEATPLNRPTIELLRQFLEALSTGNSACILQWPSASRDVSLLHPLAMIALLNAPEKRVTNGFNWCDIARSCRTLYFPWRGGAFYARQRYLLQRSDIVDPNSLHLTRSHLMPGTGSPLADKLHATLGHLNRLRIRDTTKPHLAHPALSEFYPVFVANGGDHPSPPFGEPQNELFGRVRFGAALDRMTDHRAELVVPETAPYGLFGIADKADFRQALGARALSRGGVHPDICIVDLCQGPLSSLGPAWEKIVENFVSEVVKRFPSTPITVFTHDPFVHRRAEMLLRKKRKSAQPTSRIQLRVTSDALNPDSATGWKTGAERIHFATTAGPAADAISALSEAARGCSDAVLAGTLRREIGALRKAASLPCGLTPAYEILSQEFGQSSAEAFLEGRSSATLLAPINDALMSEVGGSERARLLIARDAVDQAFRAFDDETPIGSLVADQFATIARKSSRSIVAFATDMDRLLAERRFVDESDIGQALSRKLEKNFIRFTAIDDLAGLLTGIEKAKDSNQWKRLIVVAPSANQLASLVTRRWLPEELIIVCELTLASQLSETYRRLADHPDLSGAEQLGIRLSAIAKAAKAEVEARAVATINLTLDAANTESQVDDMFIDLTDDDGSVHGSVILTLASGRRLRTRPSATIIRYNQDAELNPFERTSAKDILPSQSIVVPNAEFIAEAKDILPLRVLAENWVDIYHTMVEAQLSGVSGDSLSAKARTLLSAMRARGAGSSSQAAVLDWVRVSEHRKLPPEERRPHAPQNRHEFDAFAAALEIPEPVAERMWIEGIQQLRIDRRRAGQRMAQAFISVLVDPHGTTSHLTRDIRENIKILRKKALDHLDQVTGCEVLETEEADD